jgi:hypothetical protein
MRGSGMDCIMRVFLRKDCDASKVTYFDNPGTDLG